MNVITVADDLRLDIVLLNGSGDDTGIAMVDAGHGVVQVGQVGDTGIYGSLGMVIVGIGMGDGNRAQLAGLGNKFSGTGQLGGDVHNADQAATLLIQLPEALKIRFLQIVGILGAALLVREVGPLHLDAHETGVTLRSFLHQPLTGSEGLGQHIVRQGHGCGRKGSGTALGVELCHFFQAFVIAVGEVSAGVAVAVDFHQAGNHGGTA